MDNQIGLWLSAKFRKQKLPFEVRQCHMWRFFEVLAFIQDQGAILREKGLVRDMADDPDGIEVSEALLRVLATARYDGVRLQGGDPVPTLHRERVVEAALAIEAEEG